MKINRMVGSNVPDIRAISKVTGTMEYAADMFMPGMLYAVLIRSEYAHAIVKSIDVSEALKVPGVEVIVSYKDFPELRFGTYVYDQRAFTDRPRFVGDPIAAVAADTLAAAEEAARLVKIEYEKLPAVLNPEEAMKPDAVLIHPQMHEYKHAPFPGFFNYLEGTNCPNQFRLRKGDMEKGFAEADHIIESRIEVPPIYHGQLENHACLCKYNPDGTLTVHTCTQGPFLLREELSDALNIPMHKIKVVMSAVGGGFGGKIAASIEIRAAALAMKCKNRPVKLVMTRKEEWETVYVRQALIGYYKTGVTNEGKITAQEVKLYWDAGAYADYEVSVARSAGYMAAGPYDIPNIWIDSHAVYTNKLIATAYRGFGCSETTFCFEQTMDIIAEKLNMDPVEFRLKNVLDKGLTNATGQKLTSFALRDCIKAVSEQTNWNPKDSPDGKIKRGVGIGCMHKFTVHTVPTSDILKLNEDGTVILETSTCDIGQGSNTAMAQIVADTLGIGIDKISVVTIDTDYSPYGWQTAASSKTFFNGNSTMRAALNLRRQILDYASKFMKIPESYLDTKDGMVFQKDNPDNAIPFAAVALGVFNDEGGQSGGPIIGYGSFVVEDGTAMDKETGQGRKPSAFWMTGAMTAEVEIDTETGIIRVLRLVTANDVGKAINPAAVEGQVIGGALQGLGSALYEEVLIDEDGRVMNANMHDYKMPTFGDIPDEIVSILIETHPHPDGPYGAKGVGEPAMACPAAAIANAVANALGGRIHSLPLSPEKVLNVIQKGAK